MAEKPNDEELIIFKEMMTANYIQLDALAQLLIEKGLNTENEFHLELEEAQMEFESNGKQKVEWIKTGVVLIDHFQCYYYTDSDLA